MQISCQELMNIDSCITYFTNALLAIETGKDNEIKYNRFYHGLLKATQVQEEDSAQQHNSQSEQQMSSKSLDNLNASADISER